MPKKGGKRSAGKNKKKGATAGLAKVLRPSPRTIEESVEHVLHRLRWWLGEEGPVVSRYLSQDGRGEMTSEEFTTMLRHLQAPITFEEQQLLVRLLDSSSSGMIKVKLLTELGSATDLDLTKKAYTDPLAPLEDKDSAKKAEQEQLFPAGVQSTKGEPCAQCGITLAGPPVEESPKYTELQMTLATFKGLLSHPAHFTLNLADSSNIQAVGQHIRQHLDNAVSTVAVFRDASCSQQSLLRPSWTLERCGIVGGARHSPTHHQLFYDYIPEFTDCPILMADNAMRNVHISAQVRSSKATS